MKKYSTEWDVCDVCHGDVPPEYLWGQAGECEDGYCPGHRNSSGTCGAFAEREAYKDGE